MLISSSRHRGCLASFAVTITVLPRHRTPARLPRRNASPTRGPVPSPRVALYGHDTLGLGHLRRNLALAGTIAALPCQPDVLVLSGVAEARVFPPVRGVDLVTLPGIDKDDGGGYAPAHLSAGLEELVRLRAALLATALTSWSPDLVVVDKVPLGFGGELETALRALRRRGGTRLVLGLRDVLDAPEVARAQWRQGRCSEAVREFYDEVWIYGDPAAGDLAQDCAFPPAVRVKTRHVGLLSHGRLDSPRRPVEAGDQPYVLCLVGGGRDGGRLAARFAAARMPAGHVGVLVAGPFLPPDRLQELMIRSDGRPDLVVVPFAGDAASWLPGAAAVVAMGGYNTVAEILATDTPALLVPRVSPRREQLVRAERLARLGTVDLALPVEAGTRRIGEWLAGAVAGPRTDRSLLDRDGLAVVADRAAALLSGSPGVRERGRGGEGARCCQLSRSRCASGTWSRSTRGSPRPSSSGRSWPGRPRGRRWRSPPCGRPPTSGSTT